ncbi:glucan biosynthesis protein [Glacieibacterium sp.]|uniref:glucan biosynthesis protein n=1 Tax=Glacieibacterium sp. TaxID=2860237 RepID=UPI003B00CDEE
MLSRRDGLVALAIAALSSGKGFAALPQAPGGDSPFSWELLKALALRIADRPWRAPQPVSAAQLLSYDDIARVNYRPEKSLWAGSGDSETRFFPLQHAANLPVDIAVVEKGVARPFTFSADLFAVKADAKGIKPTLAPGFAGFRLMNANGRGDWLAFQGASYFRSAGQFDQYGLSARGLAVNTGIDGREEFPLFTRFWLERGPGSTIIIYALLEGRSVTGAYRFVTRQTPAGPVQDVSLMVHLRADVQRLGFAPLTSMFWYGEGNRAAGIDWRPEVHDSDGLALWTGAGERVWRPLVNPPQPIINAFADKAPRGFGLLQRDRRFADYQDDSAFYEKRPNLWVEPKGDWQAGSVMLYEIPTRKEIEDNIVAFWVPSAPARKGDSYALDYRLNWTGIDPLPATMARAVDSWTGTAGPPGSEPVDGARRLVVDFSGKTLVGLTRNSGVEAMVSVASGKLLGTYVYPVVGAAPRWRMIVDVGQERRKASNIRAYLKRGGDALSETFLYDLYS